MPGKSSPAKSGADATDAETIQELRGLLAQLRDVGPVIADLRAAAPILRELSQLEAGLLAGQLQDTVARIEVLEKQPRHTSQGIVSGNGFYYLNSFLISGVPCGVQPEEVAQALHALLRALRRYVQVLAAKPLRGVEKDSTIRGKDGFYTVKVVIPYGTLSDFWGVAKALREQKQWTMRDHLTREGVQQRQQLSQDFSTLVGEGMYPTWREGAVIFIRPPDAQGKPGKPERWQREQYPDEGGDEGGEEDEAASQPDGMQASPPPRPGGWRWQQAQAHRGPAERGQARQGLRGWAVRARPAQRSSAPGPALGPGVAAAG